MTDTGNPSSHTTPAGWYPDTNQPGTSRFWDGTAWTGQTSPTAGPIAASPIAANPASYWVQSMGQERGPFSPNDLQQMAKARQLAANDLVRTVDGNWFAALNVPGVFSDKDWSTALILSVLLGGLGVDQFYLGNTGLGLGKLFTLGGCGVWALIDIIRIATNGVTDSQGRPLRK